MGPYKSSKGPVSVLRVIVEGGQRIPENQGSRGQEGILRRGFRQLGATAFEATGQVLGARGQGSSVEWDVTRHRGQFREGVKAAWCESA